MSEKMGEVSAMNRLKKAASLGFGPLIERTEAGPYDTHGPPRPRSRSRGRSAGPPGDSNSAAVAVREQQERRREALRQVLKGPEDEPDLDGFLGGVRKKSASDTTTKVLGDSRSWRERKVSKMDLKISTGTSSRAAASAAGARPKAAAKAAAEAQSREAEELKQRQLEEKVRHEYEEMQKSVKKIVRPQEEEERRRDDDDSFDEEEEDKKWRKREEKRKREEWRKKRREELRKKGDLKNASSESEVDEEDEETLKLQKKEKEESRARAQTWRTINNNGRYSKVVGSYVGQLSDRELDKRISEQAAKNAGQSLMSEAEVLAKMQKGKLAGGRKRSRSRSATRKH